MRKLLLICLLAVASLNLMAQTTNDDRINLKTGKVIKCNIIQIDTVQMKIDYYLSGQKSSVPLSQVASYEWDGVINAKYPGAAQPAIREQELLTEPLTNLNSPGQQLIKFANSAQTGLTLGVLGSLCTSAAVLANTEKTQKLLLYSGLTISTVGFIVHVVSFSKARKAGELLQIKENMALKVSDNGLGLALTF